MLKVYVNNNAILVNPNTTVLETCENLGIEIPRFCFHSRLSIAGNCRMCLVEIEKSPKPVVSCAMPVMDGMKIFTNTPLVKKARENVLEFLLLNHPLDCPICDQGGECDLQDQALLYGSDRSRFYEFKRSTLDKNVGPLIKTIMTRCIHCTRCVRFAEEIAGVGDLGTTSRGITTEIGTYVEKVFQSELSGNVVDLCPVGALTSQPHAFRYRPWELKIAESIDTSDGIGSNIRIDFKEKEVIRVLPIINDEINEEWISDKTRFCYSDSLVNNRILKPEARFFTEVEQKTNQPLWWVWAPILAETNKKLSDLNLKETGNKILSYRNWETSLWFIKLILNYSSNNNLTGICSSNSNLETQSSLKYLLNSLGSSKIGFEKNYNADNSFSSNYRLNSTLKNISESDFCLLVGVNPRYEGSLLNVALRKRYLEGNFKISSIGTPSNLTYPVNHVGSSLDSFFKLLEGNHSLCKQLLNSKKPMVILGTSLFKRFDMVNIHHILKSLSKYSSINTKNWNGINILQNDANHVGSLELGYNYLDNYTLSKSKILYSLNTEEFYTKERIIPFFNYFKKKGYYHIISQGYNKINPVQEYASVILPSSSILEENGYFLNTEGRTQKTVKVLPSSKLVRNNWKIIKVLSKIVSSNLNYANKKELEYRILKSIPSINNLNRIEKSVLQTTINFVSNKKTSNIILKNLIEDFYKTNSVTKNSAIMSKCSIFLRKLSNNFDKK